MTTAGGRLLASMTWAEVPRSPILVVPLGAVEQHGPHLPLDTDTRIAEAVAHRVARALPDAVAAPALAYGASGEHQDFPGTLSIGNHALESLLVQLVRSAGHTARRTLFVSGHAGNAYALRRAVRQLRREGRHTAGWVPSAPGADAHAGWAETSMMLHLHPDAVRLDQLAPGNTAPLSELLPAIRRSSLKAVSASGVLGDPRTASAEDGAELLETMTANLLTALKKQPGHA